MLCLLVNSVQYRGHTFGGDNIYDKFWLVCFLQVFDWPLKYVLPIMSHLDLKHTLLYYYVNNLAFQNR